MSGDLLAKHRTLLEEGHTYEFLQVILSLTRRKLQRNEGELALQLASEGTKELLKSGDLNSAITLLEFVVEALKLKADLDTVQELYQILPPPHKFEFLSKVLKFCKEPALYVMLAAGYQASDDIGRSCVRCSQTNWILSGQASGIVSCLKELMSLGLAGEQDLIVGRATLQ
jgi:hypothetical protein